MIASEHFVLEWFVGYLNDCDLCCWDVETGDDCVDFYCDLEIDDNLHLPRNFIG